MKLYAPEYYKRFRCIADHSGDQILVVADGAAFGAEMQKIHMLLARDPGKIRLYLPESFEWLVLKSGILGNNSLAVFHSQNVIWFA